MNKALASWFSDNPLASWLEVALATWKRLSWNDL